MPDYGPASAPAPDLLAPIEHLDAALAAAFDELSLWSSAFGAVLLRELPLRPGMAVLDIACGTGFPAIEIAHRLGPRSRVVAVDTWPAAIERARSKAAFGEISNLDILETSAAKLPLADESFDLVTSNLGINNFESSLDVLRECAR